MLFKETNSNLEGYYSLSGGTRIPSGADMLADTYRVPGNYACMDNTIASTLKNCPISKAFILKVDLSTGNAYPRQTFLQFNNGKVFTRVFDAFENKWSETFSNITNADLDIGTYTVAVLFQSTAISSNYRAYYNFSIHKTYAVTINTASISGSGTNIKSMISASSLNGYVLFYGSDTSLAGKVAEINITVK